MEMAKASGQINDTRGSSRKYKHKCRKERKKKRSEKKYLAERQR